MSNHQHDPAMDLARLTGQQLSTTNLPISMQGATLREANGKRAAFLRDVAGPLRDCEMARVQGQFASQPLATALETKNPSTGAVTLSGGDALADFLLGNLQSSTVAVAVADANYVRNVEAAYVEDTYKTFSNLTISAGLRY